MTLQENQAYVEKNLHLLPEEEFKILFEMFDKE